MSRKSKPILIVTNIRENINGKYIINAHTTNGTPFHQMFPKYIWGGKAYIKDFEQKFKIKYKINRY